MFINMTKKKKLRLYKILTMTKKELFKWAKENSEQYPILKRLREIVIDDVKLIEWSVQFGKYPKLYFCEYDSPVVDKLRQDGYGVCAIISYGLLQEFILEDIKKAEKKQK